MTYTVASICGTNESFLNFMDYGRDVESLTGPATIKLGLNSSNNFDQSIDHSFNIPGYINFPAGTNSNQNNIGKYGHVLGSYVAVTDNKCLILNNGMKMTDSLPSYYTSVRVIQNNNIFSLELDTGGDLNQSNRNNNYFVSLGITAGINIFYMLAIDIINFNPLLKIKHSNDGLNWYDTGPSIGFDIAESDPVFKSFIKSIQGREFHEIKLHRTLSGEKYFLYSEYSSKIIYCTDTFRGWAEHSIGRFDGLHWYNDNGIMYLCAVRLSNDGCYGTKICDAQGNMEVIRWRKASTPWDSTKNRLDAGYVVGMRPLTRAKPKPVVPVFNIEDFTKAAMVLTPKLVALGRTAENVTVVGKITGMYQGKGVALFRVTKEPILSFSARYKRISFSTQNSNSIEVFSGGGTFENRNDIKFYKKDLENNEFYDTYFQGFNTEDSYKAVLVSDAQIGNSVEISITDALDSDFTGWYFGSGESLPTSNNIIYIPRAPLDIRDFIQLAPEWERGSPDNGRVFTYTLDGLTFQATIQYTWYNLPNLYGITYLVKCVF